MFKASSWEYSISDEVTLTSPDINEKWSASAHEVINELLPSLTFKLNLFKYKFFVFEEVKAIPEAELIVKFSKYIFSELLIVAPAWSYWANWRDAKVLTGPSLISLLNFTTTS